MGTTKAIGGARALARRRALQFYGLALVSALLSVAFLPAVAHSKAWWPTFQPAAGGAYCGQSSRSSSAPGGPRKGSRDGPVRVDVLDSGLRVRLGSKRKAYRRGGIVYARTENIGTTLIFDPPEYLIEHFIAGEWKRVGPRNLGWPASPPPILSSGRARCLDFRIPIHASLGFYRVVKSAEYAGTTGDRASLSLIREFKVTRSLQEQAED